MKRCSLYFDSLMTPLFSYPCTFCTGMVSDRARCMAGTWTTPLNLRSSYNPSRKQIEARQYAIVLATGQRYFLFCFFFILSNLLDFIVNNNNIYEYTIA